jgi:hypothetical protein
MKQMTWNEFANTYCERQKQTPDGLAKVLCEQALRFNSAGFMLLECQMLDSRMCGSLTILGFGGTHTYANIPTHPISPRGLASDMSVVKGYVLVSDVPATHATRLSRSKDPAR